MLHQATVIGRWPTLGCISSRSDRWSWFRSRQAGRLRVRRKGPMARGGILGANASGWLIATSWLFTKSEQNHARNAAPHSVLTGGKICVPGFHLALMRGRIIFLW